MEDMKIVTINETDSDSYYWDENRGELGGVDKLKEDWNYMGIRNRTGFFTVKKTPFKIDARSVLSNLYEELAESELGYEDLYERLDADTTEKYVKELQKVLDKINDFPTATAYTWDKYINPVVKYEGD